MIEEKKMKLYKALTILAILGSVFVAAKVVTEIKGYRFIGGGVSATNLISVSGEGEVTAVPDIATLSFTVRDEAKKVSDAQNKVSDKVKPILASVRKLGVDDKDIKTAQYSSYPKYEYRETKISCAANDYCPPQGKQVLVGYEVSEAVVIKVRNLDTTAAIIDALTQGGATEMQGPNFTIDKQEELKAKARKDAIDNARTKAETLATDLGVSLVRIVSFSEDGGVRPYYADSAPMMMKSSAEERSMPELPKGEEKIVSHVTVTYEIR